MTDTLGLLLKVKVLPANVTDRDGGEMLLKEYREAQPGLRLHLFVDGGYKGKWETLVKKTFGHTVEVIQRPDANIRGYWLPVGQTLTPEQIATFRGHRKFMPLPRRWVVERSFAWLSFNRRLNREYDLLPRTTEGFIMLAFIRIMIRRVASLEAKKAA